MTGCTSADTLAISCNLQEPYIKCSIVFISGEVKHYKQSVNSLCIVSGPPENKRDIFCNLYLLYLIDRKTALTQNDLILIFFKFISNPDISFKGGVQWKKKKGDQRGLAFLGAIFKATPLWSSLPMLVILLSLSSLC